MSHTYTIRVIYGQRPGTRIQSLYFFRARPVLLGQRLLGNTVLRVDENDLFSKRGEIEPLLRDGIIEIFDPEGKNFSYNLTGNGFFTDTLIPEVVPIPEALPELPASIPVPEPVSVVVRESEPEPVTVPAPPVETPPVVEEAPSVVSFLPELAAPSVDPEDRPRRGRRRRIVESPEDTET